MSSSPTFRLRDIIPLQEDLEAMGRKRYQQPNVFKTQGAKPMWYFRARVDVINTRDGAKVTERPEQRYYVGYADEMTKQQAKQRRDEILSEAINRPQVLIPSQVQFCEILRAYKRDHLASLRVTTQANQEGMIDTHIEPGLGKLRMCDIDALALQRWLSGMSLAYSTKQAYLRLVRIIWHKAEEWGFVQRDFPRGSYSYGVKRGVKGKELPTMEQLRRLLAALEDPYRAMAEVALYAGPRISEIRGLQWADIGDRSVTFRRRVSELNDVDLLKNGKERILDVRPLAAIFARLPQTSEWVFLDAVGCYRTCHKAMADAVTVAGIAIPMFGWHSLRAVCNTLMRQGGADSIDRQALLGHASETMNAVYVHASADDLRRQGDLMMAVQGAVMGRAKGVQ